MFSSASTFFARQLSASELVVGSVTNCLPEGEEIGGNHPENLLEDMEMDIQLRKQENLLFGK